MILLIKHICGLSILAYHPVQKAGDVLLKVGRLPIVGCEALIRAFFVVLPHVFKRIAVVVEHTVLPREILWETDADLPAAQLSTSGKR